MEFVEQYLDGKDTEGNYQTKHKPCDFLQNDGSCKLGEEPIVSLTEELVGFIFPVWSTTRSENIQYIS